MTNANRLTTAEINQKEIEIRAKLSQAQKVLDNPHVAIELTKNQMGLAGHVAPLIKLDKEVTALLAHADKDKSLDLNKLHDDILAMKRNFENLTIAGRNRSAMAAPIHAQPPAQPIAAAAVVAPQPSPEEQKDLQMAEIHLNNAVKIVDAFLQRIEGFKVKAQNEKPPSPKSLKILGLYSNLDTASKAMENQKLPIAERAEAIVSAISTFDNVIKEIGISKGFLGSVQAKLGKASVKDVLTQFAQSDNKKTLTNLHDSIADDFKLKRIMPGPVVKS